MSQIKHRLWRRTNEKSCKRGDALMKGWLLFSGDDSEWEIQQFRKYVEENDITTAADVVIKSAINKSRLKIFVIQQIDRKVDLDEIAESKSVNFGELIDEIELICYSGTKLNIDYYIDQVLDPDKQEDIVDYFLNAESDDIDEALQELGDEDYSEEDLRLMRIKFLSEYAN